MNTSLSLSRRGALTAVALAAACVLAGPAAAAAQHDLTVFTVSSDKAALEAVVAKFIEKYPGSKVRVNAADADQYQTTMRVQLTSGTAPDVIFTWPGNGNSLALAQVGPAGYLTDLSARPWTKRIPEKYRQVTQWKGKTYIVPMTETLIGAVFNKDVIEKAGVTIPKTWSEFLGTCDKLKAAGVTPIALGNATPWVTQLVNYSLVPSTVYASQPDFDERMAAGKAKFANSGWSDAMNKYLELNKRGCFNKNPLGTSFEESLQMVGSGKAAMVIQVSGIINQVRTFAGHDRFAMFAVPGADDASKVLIPAAAGSGYAVNAKSKRSAAATAFVDFLAEEETMNLYAKRIGSLPAFPIATALNDPTFEPIRPFVQSGKGVPFMDQRWPNAKVQQVHFAVVQELFSGSISVPDALGRMDAAYGAK